MNQQNAPGNMGQRPEKKNQRHRHVKKLGVRNLKKKVQAQKLRDLEFLVPQHFQNTFLSEKKRKE